MPRPGPAAFFRQSLKSDSYFADELINIYLLRPLASVIVWAVYPTRITPNMVTVAAVLIGCVAGWFYSAGTAASTVAAGVMILLKDIVDDADGQLARAKELYSRRGRLLDSIGDFLVDVCVFAGIGWLVYHARPGIAGPLLAFLGLAGITLRVSYHVFYQVSFLHTEKRYSLNRIVEEVTEEDRKGNRTDYVLQRIFGAIYTWQDRLMLWIDAWCRGGKVRDELLATWYGDRLGLRLSGLLGFGSEISLLAVCSWFDVMNAYLWLNLLLMNGIWLASVIYRRYYLRANLA
ncbi:MAG TPA: CDP-alcohol phosphatidyltransferase family protein [Bacteroidota bacterium]|nr:CDP-alcohol phosphatidyltransferase family protein [Bacteroidota bacterium]